MSVGVTHTLGIWSAARVQGGKSITDTVHEAGGHVMLQLWRTGRISHPW